MSMSGGCKCNNIQIIWHTVDHSLVPRACQCDYCLLKSAAYVSRSGTRFEVLIQRSELHRTVRQGSNCAVFHECGNCDQLVFVTADIDGELFGALNANHLRNKFGFPDALTTTYSDQTAEQKRERWRLNWCCPVRMIT